MKLTSPLLNVAPQLSFDWGDPPWVPEATSALTLPAALEPAQTQSLDPTAPFVHPDANRSLELGGQVIHYVFTRAKRKSIGMRITAAGLEVRAPRFCLISEVNRVLTERADWILQQLRKARERETSQQAQAIVWRAGGQLPFLGATLTMQLLPEHQHAGPGAKCTKHWRDLGDGQTAALWLPLPSHASESQVRDTAQAWLMQQAREIFTHRLTEYAPQLGVQWRSLKLSSAQTRWGSASRDGAIRLNWRLVHGPLSFTDYVVVHELSHLREMNHSPRFWRTVASVMPDYKHQQRELHEWVLPPH